MTDPDIAAVRSLIEGMDTHYSRALAALARVAARLEAAELERDWLAEMIVDEFGGKITVPTVASTLAGLDPETLMLMAQEIENHIRVKEVEREIVDEALRMALAGKDAG